MHQADLQHDEKSLQKKLERIFQLRRTKSAVNWDRSLYLSLLEKFGNPQNELPPVIHVAGTNGKGSIVAMLRSILEAAGKSVHCYTSPHLMQVNERIYLAGKQIEDDDLEHLLDQALEYIDDAPLSFFEITTAVAFKVFSEVPADVLLLEVGMGGRLDCTNVIKKPLATVINRISMDHTEFLGTDIRDIAKEKAGIMKDNVPCIIGHQGDGKEREDVLEVLQESAEKISAIPLYYGEDWEIEKENQKMVFSFGGDTAEFPLPALAGLHQIMNAGAVLATLKAIENTFNVSDDATAQGLKSVQWRGRMQCLNDIWPDDIGDCEIWLDSGHNDSAAEALAKQISQWKQREDKLVHLVVGMLKMKDSSAYLTPLIQHIDSLHIVPITSDPNSHTKETIMDSLGMRHCDGDKLHTHNNVFEAVEGIVKKEEKIRIVISGSVYLSGEVLKFCSGT